MRTISLSLAFVFAGATALKFRTAPRTKADFATKSQEKSVYLARIIDIPQAKAKSVKAVVELLQDKGGPIIRRPHAVIYVAKDSNARKLQYGDMLIVTTHFQRIKNANNPYTFDYEQYMARRGIYHTGYVPVQYWKMAGRHPPNRIKATTHQIQQHLSHIFSEAGMEGREYDIIRAILLGDDDTMDPTLKSAYTAAGVSHILCVSGMHVGVIFMIINFLLKSMDLMPKMRIIKATILLTCIWLYAAITGLSPSVTRSATMFTFVTVGSLLNRHTNVFHSILASLFILLTINPLLLFEVGFQLSYLAVFGIVILQPKIVALWQPKTRIVNYLWELMTVSIAAQLFTFPICTYYFGQFSNYFLLSNLSVVSLSFIVMVTGVALLVLSVVPIIGSWATFLLTHEIRIMNRIILFIEALPGAVTTHIDYSVIQVILLYVSILAVYLTVHYRRHLTGWIAYGSFALFSLSFAVKKVQIVQQQEVVYFDISKVQAVSFCYGSTGILFSDSIRSESDKNYQYSIANYARKRHLHFTFVPIDTNIYCNEFLYKRGDGVLFGNRAYNLWQADEHTQRSP